MQVTVSATGGGQAAQMLIQQPRSILLRHLQTLVEVAGIQGTKTDTLALPLSLGLLEPLLGRVAGHAVKPDKPLVA